MSFNGSGTFTINSSGQPPVAGTAITVAAHTALTADLATGLSTCICKDGQTTTTALITFAAGISTASITNSTGLASTTYTPNLTNVTNVAASTAFNSMYVRVGNIVDVYFRVDIDPTAGGSTSTFLGMSLPIASDLGSTDLWGSASDGAGQSIAISADATNNRANLFYAATNAANAAFTGSFRYKVI